MMIWCYLRRCVRRWTIKSGRSLLRRWWCVRLIHLTDMDKGF